MHRAALRLAALLVLAAPCAHAFAHGEPPEAYAVVSGDADGLRVVSFSAGLAVRRSAQRYQFVCPMAWGDQFAAPLAALADGTIVVGGTRGLVLLGSDGSLRAHPDPAAVGGTTDVVRSPHGAFALRSTLEGSEVLAVDAQQVRVLWRDTKSSYSLAALDDTLVLARATENVLEQITIAPADGAELERQTAIVELPADYTFLRVNAGVAYVVVVLRDGTVSLGALRNNRFDVVAEGALSIAGPLRVGDGMLVAVDGELMQLREGEATPLANQHTVVCLSEYDGLRYACDREGISRVNDHTLGEPLFRFGWLEPPELKQIPEGEARFMCNAQWQDFLSDLQLVMPDANGTPDASTDGNVALQPPGVAMTQDAGASQTGASAPPVAAPQQTVSPRGAACGLMPSASNNGPSSIYVLGVLIAFTVSRRWRRRRL